MACRWIFFVGAIIYPSLLTPHPIFIYIYNPSTMKVKQLNNYIMQSTRRSSIKSSLPSISTPPVSYSQRYEHMTKIANYNEMNEGQIWKQYEKLRICLKELNNDVLMHMEKKAHTNLYAKEAPPTPSVEASLYLLDEEKKINETRMQNFTNQLVSLEQKAERISNRTDYLVEVKNDIQISKSKIRELIVQNKDLKRKQKLVSKDLEAGQTYLEKFLHQEQLLHYANKKYDKYNKIFKDALIKIQKLEDQAKECDKALQVRVQSLRDHDNQIDEEINLQRYEELQGKKAHVKRFEEVYKRNYLMKLKELDNLNSSVQKHDQVIIQTEANILKMRQEIDEISAMVGAKRRQSAVIPQYPDRTFKSGRKSIVADHSLDAKENNLKKSRGPSNDKNAQYQRDSTNIN